MEHPLKTPSQTLWNGTQAHKTLSWTLSHHYTTISAMMLLVALVGLWHATKLSEVQLPMVFHFCMLFSFSNIHT